MRNVSDKSSGENQNTHFVFNNFHPPPSENLAVYETMWENIVEPDRPQMTKCRVRIARWVLEAKTQT